MMDGDLIRAVAVSGGLILLPFAAALCSARLEPAAGVDRRGRSGARRRVLI